MTKQIKKSKVAVISGSTGYVGSAIARKLAADGLTIAMLYYKTKVGIVDEIVKALPGSKHQAIRCDLEDMEEVSKVIKSIEEDLGQIYVCIHAAGTKPKRGLLLLSSVEDLVDQFKVNVYGSFNFLSACARILKGNKGGVIVGITTAGVVVPKAGRSLGAYLPAKYALQGILATFKDELEPFGLRVYSVAPGFMDGGMNSDIPKSFVEMVRIKSPTKALTSADEIANKVSFLCSDKGAVVKDLTLLVAPELVN